ncbi:hypothetical protein AVEN_75280-1 [Araneus ventricosus]|uniref:Uncharacterized protein n=1 Tax=Araneus ventricosus TaxID=182803 RepID=A0A4Y2NH39_ARAVE|nr:hypothetical protein AVEN_75280-1 [Araneus ventricosus]
MKLNKVSADVSTSPLFPGLKPFRQTGTDPDLAVNDYHLFQHLKRFLPKQHFSSDGDKHTDGFHRLIPLSGGNSLRTCLQKLVSRYDSGFNSGGSYAESGTVIAIVIDIANLEALKKSRKTDRAAFTKAYNKVELITLEVVDISELEAELNVLKVKSDRLEITHASILELLPEKDFEAEFEVVEDFRDRAIRIETKARRIITCQQNVSTILNTTEKRRFKLPKLELRKFDGDVKEWLYFWSQFEKIHDDSSIEDSDKFQYLLQSTVEGSRAREVIESFQPTGDNYPKAIDCLKTRFGRNDLQVEVYVRELLKLVLKNANSNFCSNNLCALYDNLEQQIRALETLGVTTDKSAALLYPLVESCMPENFLRAWQRNSNFDLGSDSKKGLIVYKNF